MERLGADRARIAAAIGPCIARASYEVDAAFVARFEEADPANERFFAAGRARPAQFDLAAYVAQRPAADGIASVEMLGEDTSATAARCSSYRRAPHRGYPPSGRPTSTIGLRRRVS